MMSKVRASSRALQKSDLVDLLIRLNLDAFV